MTGMISTQRTTDAVDDRASSADGEAPTTRLALSVAEAAHALGISRTLAYELAQTGQLRSVKLGRRVVVPRSAVLELLERPTDR